MTESVRKTANAFTNGVFNGRKIKVSFLHKTFIFNGKATICKVGAKIDTGCFYDIDEETCLNLNYITGEGVAICQPCDEYSQAKGKLVSSAKAECEVYRNARKLIAEELLKAKAKQKLLEFAINDLERYETHNKEIVGKQ